MTTVKDKIIDTFDLDREQVDRVIAKVEDLIREGNVRRVVVKNAAGETVIEAPLTVGVVGAALAPVWAAIGAIAALATRFTIELERRD